LIDQHHANLFNINVVQMYADGIKSLKYTGKEIKINNQYTKMQLKH